MKTINNIALLKKRILQNQSERSKTIIINVFNSSIVKAFSIITSFLLIPISIDCINTENYGVWLTISSVITWINIFDIGLINSLRNKITESIALQNWSMAQTYTSTTYALLLLLIIPVYFAFLLLYPTLNWQSIFNTTIPKESLEYIVLSVFTSFCLQFLLKPITSILLADQKHFIANTIYLIINILSIALILLFKQHFNGSLFLLSLLFGFMPCIVLAFISIILYLNKYRALKPTFKSIKFKYTKELLGIGIKFFIIQIAGLIIFSSNNFIISHLLGNEQVTYFNIVLRYFSVITIGYSLVNAPFWTAYTEAYAVKDWQWIRKVTKQANYLCTGLSFLTLIMLLISPWVYKAWINQSIEIPFELSALMAINVGVTLFAGTYTSFINGTGKIRFQTFFCIFISLVHIPIGYYLIKNLRLGLNGLVILTIIWSVLSLIFWRTQYTKIMNNSPKYIWN